jgi:hypothetical protein
MPQSDKPITLNFDREGLLSFLPKNSIGVEVGVERGEYSEKIVNIVSPKKLYLVDSWIDVMTGKFRDQKESARQEKNYQDVLSRFKNNHNVEIIRDSSQNASKKIEIDNLDWAYIDADHSYDAVLNDLSIWGEKIKAGGFICGHDWLVKPKKKKGVEFGVNKAVEDYISKKKFEFIGVTNEINFKSFIIKKT